MFERITILTVIGLLGSAPPALTGPTDIPAFARRYGVSCSLCHAPMPTLTDFGETFAGNGFRFTAEEPPQDTIDTGDPLLELTERLPLAIRFDAYLQAFTDGDFASDFETPYNLKILSGGSISSSISYYLYFFLFERGEVGGVEDAFVYINDIARQPVDVAVGQFQVSDPLFKRELRLEFEDYAIYRAQIGDQPADLTYDRGLMAIGEYGDFTLTAIAVNGNGRGEALENRRFDNDPIKNFMGHASRDLIPGGRFGLMGYLGRQELQDEPGAADNRIWMLGPDATLVYGTFELNLQYIHREDDAPTFAPAERTAVTDGGFAELIYRPRNSRWYGYGLYNFVEANRPLLDVRLGGPANIRRYNTLAGGAGYLLRRNFRVTGELTWDLEQDATRWTLGLVSAF